ncbi:MAG TPA: PPC domain-containing DNA-binding protein [Candidatus Acidoferrales bacterium]
MNSTFKSAKLIAISLTILATSLAVSAQQQPAPATPEKAAAKPADWTQQLAARHEAFDAEHMRIHVFRLRPGDDLLEGIRAYASAHQLHAAVVLTAVGSLTQASIRYANQPSASQSSGHFEIVSLVGTLEDGGEHLHLSLAAENGTVIGGHLVPGCKIYTTGEIVLGELQGARFTRELDKEGSGWEELKVYPAADEQK